MTMPKVPIRRRKKEKDRDTSFHAEKQKQETETTGTKDVFIIFASTQKRRTHSGQIGHADDQSRPGVCRSGVPSRLAGHCQPLVTVDWSKKLPNISSGGDCDQVSCVCRMHKIFSKKSDGSA